MSRFNPFQRIPSRLAALLLWPVLGLVPAAAAATELSAVEQKIVAAIQAHSPAALQFLERSVNINSGTMNLDGVGKVGELFRAEFDALGFTTEWRAMPAEMGRAGHLLATRTGSQGKRLLLIGHLDTVFEKDSPLQQWRRSGDRVHGPGVSDMKGGDVIIIEALRALHQVGMLDGTTIRVIFSGDEERPGSPLETARADMIAAAKASDIALAFEGLVNQDGHDTATIGRRAASSWTLQVSGKQGHSAGVFGASAGYGAIYEAARIINAFREQLIEADLTFNPGLILGGTEVAFDGAGSRGTAFGKTNVIANSARVEGDLRFLSNEQRDRVRARMRAIVAASLPGTHGEISFQDSYPPMSPTAGNLRLLDAYSKASIDAGLGAINALPPGLRGAGDVQFVAPFIDCLDGLGAAGGGAHSPEETLEVASIERSAIRAALLIYRLTRP
jgi:glutamate carboxypeptidase